MKMFTTIAVTTALLGLAACSKNEPAPATPVEAPAAAPVDNATAPAVPAATAAPAEQPK